MDIRYVFWPLWLVFGIIVYNRWEVGGGVLEALVLFAHRLHHQHHDLSIAYIA